MIRSQISRILLISLVFLQTFSLVQSKCVNSTQFKYDLDELSSIAGYHAVCSEHAGRTCCSRNNFQQLSRKIYKVLGTSQLSFGCKRSLTNLLCMPCDGDVGQQLRQGVCLNYCEHLYKHCAQDYFSIDSNNQLKACREEDIICSKLSDIITQQGPESVCQLFDEEPKKMNCWNGEISAILKGAIKQKQKPQSRYTKSSHKNKKPSNKQESPKKQQPKKGKKAETTQETKQEQGWISESLQTYLSLFVFLIIIFIGLWLKKMYRRWKRQFRSHK